LKGKRVQADGTSAEVTQLPPEGERYRKAGRYQGSTAPAIEEEIVQFLPGRVPIVKGLACRPGNIPGEPEKNEHPNDSALHVSQYISLAKLGQEITSG